LYREIDDARCRGIVGMRGTSRKTEVCQTGRIEHPAASMQSATPSRAFTLTPRDKVDLNVLYFCRGTGYFQTHPGTPGDDRWVSPALKVA
jgi:hypothetical protein